MLLVVIGGAWDVWWHTMVGRETFFEPPHLMIYGGVLIAVAVGFLAWRVRGELRWKRLALALLAIPLIVAPFDEIWHRIFGFEDLTSVWIIWSPPHVALDLSLIGVVVLLLPFVDREREELRNFFGAAAFATLITLLSFLVIPLDPEGPFHLFGWWGALGASAVLTASLAYGARFLRGSVSALTIAVFLMVYIAIDAEVGVKSPDIIMRPYFDYPTWLVVFALLSFAALIDGVKAIPLPGRGALGGLLWGLILYGAGSFFVPEAFSYGTPAIVAAAISATIGGFFGGIAATRLPLAR